MIGSKERGKRILHSFGDFKLRENEKHFAPAFRVGDHIFPTNA